MGNFLFGFVENAEFRKVPRAVHIKIRKLLMAKIRQAGVASGKWLCRIKYQKKGTAHTPVFRPDKLHGRNMLVEVKPGGNETAYVVELIPPEELKLEDVFTALGEVAQERHGKGVNAGEDMEDRLLAEISELESREERLIRNYERRLRPIAERLQVLRTTLETIRGIREEDELP